MFWPRLALSLQNGATRAEKNVDGEATMKGVRAGVLSTETSLFLAGLQPLPDKE
jgi:hypothetical protein